MFTTCARLALRGRLPRYGLVGGRGSPTPCGMVHLSGQSAGARAQRQAIFRPRFMSTQSTPPPTPPKGQEVVGEGPSTTDSQGDTGNTERDTAADPPIRAPKATRQIHHLPTRNQVLQAEQDAKEAEAAAQVASASSSSWWSRMGMLRYVLGGGVGVVAVVSALNMYKHWQLGEYADVELRPVHVGGASLLRKTAPVRFTDEMGFAVADIPVTRRMITKCGDGHAVNEAQVTDLLARAVLSNPWLHVISHTLDTLTHLGAFSLYWYTRESIRSGVEAVKAPDQRYSVMTATEAAAVPDYSTYQQRITDLPMLPGNGASSFMIIDRSDNEIVIRHIPDKDTQSPVQSLYIAVSFKVIDGLETQAIIALGWNIEDGISAGLFRPILGVLIAPVIVDSMRQLRATFDNDF